MGDAFSNCVPFVTNTTRDPCSPSPCGPGELCTVHGDNIALCDPCSAADAMYNPNCRPECLSNSDCAFDKACLGQKCNDPCEGSCGNNAQCRVEHHRPICFCPSGLYGNPYEHCSRGESKQESCDTIKCGSNTECRQQNGVLACVCKKDHYGDPLVGCRPQCVINTDCPVEKACINTKCQDPCIGVCGVNALCRVVNHAPTCYCGHGMTGNAQIQCTTQEYLPPIQQNPCDPNPCGPNSKCRQTPDGVAICSCIEGYKGMPPACQAECTINADCSLNKACINLKCIDPCPGTCGIGARCEVVNHNPICSCPPNHEGDPFLQCVERRRDDPEEPKQTNPCVPSPCGPNSICQVKGTRPVCSCAPNYVGSPPYCRPECVLSSECPADKACINEKCQNPCSNACGENADCHVVSHSAYCSCRKGYEGDAFIGCSEVPRDIPVPVDPCNPSPCAENAQCSVVNGAAKCTCIPPYFGDPYSSGCRPECVLNSDCPSQKACINQHCTNPCTGICGTNAQCIVVNHVPVCECQIGYVGDAFSGCKKFIPPKPVDSNPCENCRPPSICRIVGGRTTCSCPEGYRGAPPACRPECSSNEECRRDQSCENLKCVDPCRGHCGQNAKCQVINHKPFCSCNPGYIGDPFTQCSEKPRDVQPVHPCQPNPCGPNSECREMNDRAVCSCITGMLGAPPNCRPECERDQDCPFDRACNRGKCVIACTGSCGFNAYCNARDHRAECFCMDGFEGDPYFGCNPKGKWLIFVIFNIYIYRTCT